MNLQSIDLNLLLALDALMTERSVTRAAKTMGLSQPAMSSALGRLRRLLDDPVLVRTTTGMTPAPRAAALMGPLREALEGIERALRAGQRFEPLRSTSTFRLAATDHGGLLLLPPLLARLAA